MGYLSHNAHAAVTVSTQSAYIGRFAPSPSGPLHMGSLVAALGSYLHARAHKGRWLVRIEDIDPPRETKDAASTILHQLEAHGLYWDDTVLYQSTRHAAYDEALNYLHSQHCLFACACSRKRLSEFTLYDGHCRALQYPVSTGYAWRIVPATYPLPFTDEWHGECRFESAERDAFVLRRRDGLYAYQLAVVLDDIFQQITHVVRGADLLDTTPRQLYLYDCLAAKKPQFGHLPLVLLADGRKLSKQNLAPALNQQRCTSNLITALQFLGQQTSADMNDLSPTELLQQAVLAWESQRVPASKPSTVSGTEQSDTD